MTNEDDGSRSRVVKVLHAGTGAAMASAHGRFWFVEPGAMVAVLEVLDSATLVDLASMREKFEARAGRAPRSGDRGGYTVNAQGAAVIPFVGVMTKRPNCLADLFGDGSASTLQLIETLKAAGDDPDVKDRWVVAETPGGEVGGAFAAADYIWSQRGSDKPIHFYGEDQMTSGGQLLASQAASVWGNTNLVSGSIGVMTTIVDSSAAHAQRGLRVILVKAGKEKGVGAKGVPVGTAAVANIQRRVDSFHALFKGHVQRGYGMTDDEITRVSEAGVYIGSEGVDVGLIDGIASSLEEAIESARSAATSKKGRRTMTKNTGAAAPTAEELAATRELDLMNELLSGDGSAGESVGDVPYIAADGTAAVMSIEPATAILSALAKAGATTPEAVSGLLARAADGDGFIASLRNAAKRMAIIAHGSAGASLASDIDKMNVESLKDTIENYKGIAKEKGLTGSAAVRVSAPLSAPGAANTDRTALPTQAGAAEGIGSIGDRIAAQRNSLRQEGVY